MSAPGVLQDYKDTIAFAKLGASDTMSDDESDKGESSESDREDMEEPVQLDPPPPMKGHKDPPGVYGEEEHLRQKLAGGRAVRVLFKGPPPTRAEIDKLIEMLKISADQYPESENKSGP